MGIRLFLKIVILVYLSVSLQADYMRDDSKNIVLDTGSNLMWIDGNETFSGNWDAAVDGCKNSTFAGYSDWRLPNFNELFNLVDFTKSFPSLPDAFEYYESSRYWSSTTVSSSQTSRQPSPASYAWGVWFDKGESFVTEKTDPTYYRCVRGGLN